MVFLMILPKHSEETTSLGNVRSPSLTLPITLRVRDLSIFPNYLVLFFKELVHAIGWYIVSKDEDQSLDFLVDALLFLIPLPPSRPLNKLWAVCHGRNHSKILWGHLLWLHRLYIAQMKAGGVNCIEYNGIAIPEVGQCPICTVRYDSKYMDQL